ncbi:hypothetical protein EGT74_17975 [Chitinophaga lutea]|uniref:Lipoprotein n=2 Tax=Chitinophaga lutea TaxID=2488634 RepID=A0A3N4PXU6_9BACT|nr:hypothetical protein EGT74_17975 [Chitinophaga lutea]
MAGMLSVSCSPDQRQFPDVGREKHLVLDAVDSHKQDTVPAFPEETYSRILLHLNHGRKSDKWPVHGTVPAKGALLPYNRIMAFYGNLYSTRMGILGALPPDSLVARLKAQALQWQQADTLLPVIPALHYIAVTAQRQPGKDNRYRLRMPHSQIDRVLTMARSAGAITFLDIQQGQSEALPEAMSLEKYLVQPDVHLGIDPEYAMKAGQVPCSVIGSLDAAAVNAVTVYLAALVQAHNLPPKVLVVHRFTQAMLTNYSSIVRRPEVQIVINMDGFGSPAKKRDSYNSWISRQPVEYTGFKLFYTVDPATGGRLMEPAEVLKLFPSPVYIQYQ